MRVRAANSVDSTSGNEAGPVPGMWGSEEGLAQRLEHVIEKAKFFPEGQVEKVVTSDLQLSPNA